MCIRDRFYPDFHSAYQRDRAACGRYSDDVVLLQNQKIRYAYQMCIRDSPEGFKEYYHGPQDIPPEHRIFAYPEKEIGRAHV